MAPAPLARLPLGGLNPGRINQGIAFHEYPDVPPYPASHGCVRVPATEAKGVYDFAALGTPVVML